MAVTVMVELPLLTLAVAVPDWSRRPALTVHSSYDASAAPRPADGCGPWQLFGVRVVAKVNGRPNLAARSRVRQLQFEAPERASRHRDRRLHLTLAGGSHLNGAGSYCADAASRVNFTIAVLALDMYQQTREHVIAGVTRCR